MAKNKFRTTKFRIKRIKKMKNNSKYLFGPIPSRRLGLSLGVDLVPYKTCSLDCIYCECGATTNLTLERKEYIPLKSLIEELTNTLNENPKIDYITFSGNGEPTLHSRIGEVIAFIKSNYPHLKICLLTNSTLLSDPQVINDVAEIDLIIPSLDTVNLCEFRKINRPCIDISIDEIIQGLIDFRQKSNAKMLLEILVLKVINDSIKTFQDLRPYLKSINPDKIQLNTLDRPGVLNDIFPVEKQQLEKLISVINDIATTEIVAKFAYKQSETTSNKIYENIDEKILDFISRRPCTKEDVLFALEIDEKSLEKSLMNMKNNKTIKTNNGQRGIFYSI